MDGVLRRGGGVEHEEDGGMARSGGLGALGLELLARQARHRPVLGGGQEQRIVAERADSQVIAVDRLEPIPHRVDALGDGLVAIVVALAEELHDAEQLALGEEGELDDALRPAGLAVAGTALRSQISANGLPWPSTTR